MANQFLKLRRSSVPSKIPDTASLDFGEIALNTFDGRAFMKKSSSLGEEVIIIGSTQGAFTGSFSGSFTGSLFGTASWAYNALTASTADNFVVRGTLTGSNALFTGTVTAQTLVVQTISSSIIYSSGSNIFGDELTDRQTFTGSVSITGSLTVNGSSAILSNQTASMSVLSASYAYTASSAISSSFAISASFIPTSSLINNFFAQGGNSFGDTALLGTNDTQNLAFETNGSTRVLISGSTGHVGINTTTLPSGISPAGLSLGGSAKSPTILTTFQHYSPNANVDQGLIGWNYYWNGSALTRNNTSFTAIRFAANPGNSNIFTSFFVSMTNTAGADITAFNTGLNTAGTGVTFSLPATASSLSIRKGNASNLTAAIDVSGSVLITGSLSVTTGITGSLFGTASWAQNFLTSSVTSASYALTASYVNPLNQQVIITGSLIQGLEGNIATGEYSHAEGSITKAIGDYSHAEGDNTQAKGNYSHAEGQETIASGSYSHAEGYQTIALGNHQHVQGQYNAVSSVPVAFIVGNGTDDSNRSNLIYAAGNEVQITGSLNVSGSITGSLFGTASWATNFITSSVTSASYAYTASSAISASYALTASYFSGYVSPFPYTGSAQITGSLGVTGSVGIGSSLIDYNENTNVTTGSWRVIASEATSSYRSAFFDYVMFSGSISRAGSVYTVWSGSSTEFFETYTNDIGGSTSGVTLQTAISGSNIQLQATASAFTWSIRSLVRML